MLALDLRRLSRYAEAEPRLRQALEIRERVLRKEHPDTLTGVNNLAALCFAQGDWRRGGGGVIKRAQIRSER